MTTPGSHSGTGRERDRISPTLAVCFGIPVLVLAGSYLWLALDHGTPLLWNVVVHESGRYTLKETVFYFRHFLREVPTVVAYTLFLMGVSGAADPGMWIPRERVHLVGAGALLLAVALVGTALLITAGSAGWSSALRDLLQYRTRDDLVAYGTHWRFHWLSTLWFGAGALITPRLGRTLPGRPELRLSPRWVLAAWGFFVLATAVFGLSGEVFLDPRYVGHQAREILTHGPITTLLGIGLLVAVTPMHLLTEAADGRLRPSRARRLVSWGAAAVFLLVPLYLAVVGLARNAMAEGQTEGGLPAMIGAHYFEHTLDYLCVMLLLVAGVGLNRPRSRVPTPRTF